MKTLKEIGEIEIPESTQLEKNLDRYGNKSNSCICCGKPTNQRYWINTVEGPGAIKSNVTDEDLEGLGLHSQGSFPIGSECRKRLPKDYVIDTENNKQLNK